MSIVSTVDEWNVTMATTGPQGRASRDDRSQGRLWDRWLQSVLVCVLVYSTVLVVSGRTAGRLFDLLGFGMREAGIPSGGSAEQHVLLVYGVLGSVLIGWMTTLLLIARGPLRQRDPWAWTAFASVFPLWFVIDTTFSLAVGARTHALFNIVFLLAVAPPLVGMRAQLRDTDRTSVSSGS